MKNREEQYGLWLIQRGKIKEATEKIDRIDSVVRYDYMGSSEFEYGALPKSFRRIMENYNDFSFIEVPGIRTNDGIVMYTFCKKDEKDITFKRCEFLATHKYEYKEFCDIAEYMIGGIMDHVNNFWWDIEHDFMIIFGDTHKRILETGINNSYDFYVKNHESK